MSIPSLKTFCLEAIVNMEKPQKWQEKWHHVIPDSLLKTLVEGHQVKVSKKRMGFRYDLKNISEEGSSDYLDSISTEEVSETFWISHDAAISDLIIRILEAYQPIYQKIGMIVSDVEQDKQIYKLGEKAISQADSYKLLSLFAEPGEVLSVTVSTHL